MITGGARFEDLGNASFERQPQSPRQLLASMTQAGADLGKAGNVLNALTNAIPQPTKEDKGTSLQQNYAFLRSLGMSHEEALKGANAGGTNVSVNMPQVGTIPSGQRLVYDEQGRPVRMENIAGGPAEAERMATAQAQGRAAGFIMRDINSLVKVIDKIPDSVYGRIVAGQLPHTQTFQAGILMDSVKATIAVDQLLEIKRQGSGLGQVPQQQLEYLAQLLGALNMNMEKPRLKDHLDEIKDVYGRVLNRMTKEERSLVGVAEKEFDKWSGTEQSKPKGSVPNGLTQEEWDVLTPEERSIWNK